MIPISFCLILLAIVQAARCAEIKDDGVRVAGTNDKCAEFCSTTFVDKDAAKKSCQQGCRLYSVLQFVDKAAQAALAEPNSTAIKISCQNECDQAYADVALKGACVEGCRHQTPFTTGRMKIVMDDSSPIFPFATKLVANAFGKFDDIQNRMKEHLEKVKNWLKTDPFVSSPILKLDNNAEQQNDPMGFFDRVDSKFFQNFFDSISQSRLNSLKSEPRLIGGSEDVKSKSQAGTVNPLFAYAQSLLSDRNPIIKQSHPNHLVDGNQFNFGPSVPPISNVDENGEPIIIVKMIKNDGLFDGDEKSKDENGNNAWFSFTQESFDGKPHDPSPPLSSDDAAFVDANNTWLACLARRTQGLSMLTRWLLCAALMMSILCMIYLCLAVMRTNQQRRRRLYLQYKMGNSDAIYLMPPPTYEKFGAPPGYPLKNEQTKSESPPPAYEIAVGSNSVEKAEPVTEEV